MRWVVALIAAAVACRDTPAPPKQSETTAGRGSDFVGQAMPRTASPTEPGRVTLPRTPNTPPHRTARPLDRKELERLSALEFKDFSRQDRGTRERFAEFRYTTTTRPYLGVTIAIEPCDPCTPMELDAWTARTGELKQSLSEQLIGRPDTRFEVGARDVLGAPAIYTYQLGAFFGKDESGQPIAVYSDAYILYYNDGVNQIRVNASYLDDMIGGHDKLLAVAPPEDLEKLAVAFMSFYLHEWR